MVKYRLYDVTVTLLTPLHIGSGRELLHEYDYAIHEGRTWRIDEHACLEAQDVDDPAVARQLARTPPAGLLQMEDFCPDAPFFRYVLRGTPRSSAEGASLREQLKGPRDRPYLPGTSLKGALRTAIAWYAWEELGLRPEGRKLERSRKFAAREYEHEIFGPSPNKDLLRALHVVDSAAVDPGRLMLVNARVLHRSGQAASPIELEALRPDTAFQGTMKLDEALFSGWARQRGLHLRGENWLQDLPRIVQAHTAGRLAQEVAWFDGVRSAGQVYDFYKKLQRARLPGNAFLLQVGWGTGWDGKTLGSRLKTDPRFMDGILRSPRDGGFGLSRGRRQPGDPFPKTRRVAMQVHRSQDGRVEERPVSPLGWTLVELQEQ